MIGTISANNRLIPATVVRARCGKGSPTGIKCGTVSKIEVGLRRPTPFCISARQVAVAGVQPISSVRTWTPRLEQEKLGTSRRTLT